MHKIGLVIAAVLLAFGCARQGEHASPPATAKTEAAAATYHAPEGAMTVGEAITLATPVQLAVVKRSPSDWFEKTILVEATAADVCQVKGCWLTLTDGQGEPIWVRWASGCGGKYAFPKDAPGRRVIVQGSIYEKEVDAAAAEHLAGESAGLDAKKIAGKTLEMNVTACVILPGEAAKQDAS